jgi:serine O-acetyltransferase
MPSGADERRRILASWRSDYRLIRGSQGFVGAPASRLRVLSVRTLATGLFRVSQYAGTVSGGLAAALKQLNHLLTGADLAWQAGIGPGLVLYHPTGVVIGPYCSAGENLVVQQGVTIGGGGDEFGGIHESPVIGDRVRLGAGSRVVGSVTVGDDVQVGANAVVTKSVAAATTVVGVPARPL